LLIFLILKNNYFFLFGGMEFICSFVNEINRMLKNKVGRPLKFKQQTSVIGVRVPKDSKLIYKIEIDKTVYNLAKERGDLKID